jgi:hypothetical protein
MVVGNLKRIHAILLVLGINFSVNHTNASAKVGAKLTDLFETLEDRQLMFDEIVDVLG